MCLYSGFDFFSISCSCLLLPGVHPEGGKVIHGEKHAGRTSEENRAVYSSAISAWELPYKKHLLHFVLNMVLWKINSAMACPPRLWASPGTKLHVAARPILCMQSAAVASPSRLFLRVTSVSVCMPAYHLRWVSCVGRVNRCGLSPCCAIDSSYSSVHLLH